jgi:hypothetical protein
MNWKSVALNRETWDKQLRKALPLGGLLRQWRWWKRWYKKVNS